MKKFGLAGLALMSFALAGCGTKVAKLSPPPPVCIEYDFSEVLVSYGPALAKEQTLQDFSKRVNRYLTGKLREIGVQSSTAACRSGNDAVLHVRLDSIEAYSKDKISWISLTGAIQTSQGRVKYLATFRSPAGAVLVEDDDDRSKESLDELAESMAGKLYKLVKPFY